MIFDIMKKNYQKTKKGKGSALAYGLIIMFAVSIILVSTLQFVVSQMKFSIWTNNKEQAFQLAEAGINYYKWYLAKKTSTLSQEQLNAFWAGNFLGKAGSNYHVPFPQGSPIGEYKIEVVPPEINSTILTVKVTGWTYKNPNLKRIVQVRFRKPSWSEYAVVTDVFTRFGEGTEINGKIHSNAGIRFDGVAHNLITSKWDTYDDPDHTGNPEFGVHTHKDVGGSINENFRPAEAPPNSVPARGDVFMGGRQFPVPEVPFTGFSTGNDFMKEEAQNGNGKYFDNTGSGRKIILKTDGTFDVCTISTNAYNTSAFTISQYNGVIAGATGSSAGDNGNPCFTTACCSQNNCNYLSPQRKGKCVSMENYTIPNNGVIFVENNVWVYGTINNKKVTIVAAKIGESDPTNYGKNIYIGENNLSYTNYDGKDIIGLVAQRDISVVRDSQTTLNIDAALLAQNGRVGRESYDNIYKTSITVNGAIATKQRYGFAYVGNHNCGGGVLIGNGYCTRKLNFDNNLLYYPPPYFPTGDAYVLDLWEEL